MKYAEFIRVLADTRTDIELRFHGRWGIAYDSPKVKEMTEHPAFGSDILRDAVEVTCKVAAIREVLDNLKKS